MMGKDYVGFGCLFLALILLLLPNPIPLLDKGNYNHQITFNNSNATQLNISFIFNEDVIRDYYLIKNNEKVYLNYLNIYIDEFNDNTSIYNISSFLLDKTLFTPIDKKYQYSLQLEPETLNPINQNLIINKESELNITTIELSYYGSNIIYYETYSFFMSIFLIMLVVLGLTTLII